MAEREKRVYVMVSRKVAVTLVTVGLCLFLGILASFQYANFIDRKSNQRWCGVVGLFNESYKEVPPTNPTGVKIAKEMFIIEKEFSCPAH